MLKQSRKMQVVLGTMAVLGFCTLFLTSSSAAADTKPFEKFYVYKDKPSALNHFIPSGYIPDGKCVSMLDTWVDNCGDSRSCYQAKFDRDCTTVTGQGWAGIYWVDPANNWGDVKGGFNLTGAKRIVFGARGEKGGEVVVFKMGGVGMAGHPFPDTDAGGTDPITLTKEWKEYSIDLTGKDLSHIIGGFCWVGTAKENQSNITFYIKDIYYE